MEVDVRHRQKVAEKERVDLLPLQVLGRGDCVELMNAFEPACIVHGARVTGAQCQNGETGETIR